MPDFIDSASDNEAKQTEVALANQLAASALQKSQHPHGETHCVECGEEIPAARRKHLPHCCTCVACQQLIELKVKR
ncbi:TraR/DksA C4-type zinc finger protein [Enterovibrio sp. ZSDZ42]|uniref:TraR/DksA C4-type zinc finger protein n=1 Tax=Enterovibrio gelatinilyticus TaxID=2899819 RepID=A0ABT5QYB5_9GAMM|nr:TraR/DksA C4-type zinc finger protein [Enterovibrio sp. ZSDZ42]MDD1792521.1 TraR/DksA C4-type zinc finger protein [Enterovibrio sp. ZSDZ42]